MTTINLHEFFYWYVTDEYIEVSEEVAAVLRSDKRYEGRHYERQKRNKANYSLDAGDGIENSIVEFEPSSQELLERKERFMRLCCALNSLPDTQGQRVYERYLLGRSAEAIAAAEGVDACTVRQSIQRGLGNMRKYLKNFS